MAKQQAHGKQAQQQTQAQKKMAKVIVSTKNDKGKHAFRETMVEQDNVKDFIQKAQS